jgi:hypothetical protein
MTNDRRKKGLARVIVLPAPAIFWTMLAYCGEERAFHEITDENRRFHSEQAVSEMAMFRH